MLLLLKCPCIFPCSQGADDTAKSCQEFHQCLTVIDLEHQNGNSMATYRFMNHPVKQRGASFQTAMRRTLLARIVQQGKAWPVATRCECENPQACCMGSNAEVQEASFELVSRVMKFVEYKLDKLTPINFDGSLISNTLQTELCVNQRSRFLERLPICKVTKDLFPEAFANLCTNLKKIVCENGEDGLQIGSHKFVNDHRQKSHVGHPSIKAMIEETA